MRFSLLASLVGIALSGSASGNTGIAPACVYKVQAFVAHQGDDLFFMQIDLKRHLERGACVEVVHATNGKPREETWAFSANLDIGALAAWSSMLGSPTPDASTWTMDRPTTRPYYPNPAGHRLVRYTSADGRVTHVHFGLDNFWEGRAWGSHTAFTQIQADSTRSVKAYPFRVADQAATEREADQYGYTQFVGTLGEWALQYEPDIVYLQDAFITTPYTALCQQCGENHDHPDHIAMGRATLRALKVAGLNPATQFYVGDAIAGRATNLSSAQAEAKARAASWYGKHDSRYSCVQASSVSAPTCNWPAEGEAKWLGSQYLVMQQSDGIGAWALPAQASNPGGAIVAHVGTRDNRLHVASSAAGGVKQVEGRFAGTPAVVVGADARSSVFVRTADHDLAYLSANAGGGWSPLTTWSDKLIVSSPKAALNGDGRIAVVARAVDKALLYRAESAAGGAWAGWTPTGLSGYGDPAIARDASGALVIAMQGIDRAAAIRSQAQPGSPVFQEVAFPRKRSLGMNPLLLTAADGSVMVVLKEVVARQTSDFVVYRQAVRGPLTSAATWVRTPLNLRQDWINADAVIVDGKVMLAGNCGKERHWEEVNRESRRYDGLCVWNGVEVAELGPVDGAPRFLGDSAADLSLLVRGPGTGAPVRQSKLQGGSWSAFKDL